VNLSTATAIVAVVSIDVTKYLGMVPAYGSCRSLHMFFFFIIKFFFFFIFKLKKGLTAYGTVSLKTLK
jgi:hypothetical protein